MTYPETEGVTILGSTGIEIEQVLSWYVARVDCEIIQAVKVLKVEALQVPAILSVTVIGHVDLICWCASWREW